MCAKGALNRHVTFRLFLLPRDAMRKRGACRRPVCLSVRHTRVLYRSDLKYHKTSFSTRESHPSGCLSTIAVTQFPQWGR